MADGIASVARRDERSAREFGDLTCEITQWELQLWPGQFINVRLLIETLNRIVVVPTGAVQRGPTGTFVYVVRGDDTVTVRMVRVKQQDDQQAAIDEGLSAGEIVVTSGFGRLREGEKVTVDRPDNAGPTNQVKGKGKGKRASTAGE